MGRWIWPEQAPQASPDGRVMAAIGILALATFPATGWHEALTAGTVALTALALGLVMSMRAPGVRASMRPIPPHAVAGGRLSVSVDMSNPSVRSRSRPMACSLAVESVAPSGKAEIRRVTVMVPKLAPGASYATQVEMGALRRGMLRVGPLTANAGDPFGLVRRAVTLAQTIQVPVHPRTVPLRPGLRGPRRQDDGIHASAAAQDEFEFHALREYEPGDDPRRIHWLSCARTDGLMVRRHEQTRHMDAALRIDMDPSSYAAEEDFELAVSAYASLGVSWLRSGHPLSVEREGRYRRVPDETSFMDECCLLRLVAERPERQRRTSHVSDDVALAAVFTGGAAPSGSASPLVSTTPAAHRTLLVRAICGSSPAAHASGGVTTASIGALEDLPGLLEALP